ncbi:hypothetical protein EDD18DRAFT_1358674 [Armillaria luteobubalina]|uniref:Uncharacterized protein n=1 Tax=Armillaria luteobubalina TaxID=153913 RepID=A0AA39PVU0_9AGAR|nr:hypothetical protein EDD18DRAFT_1358674 [Armillaria luteobubalina]
MSHPSSIEQHASVSSSTHGNFISPSEPMSSLPNELHGLLLCDGPQELQLAGHKPGSPFIWHPSHTADVPLLSTVYDMLSQAFYAARPDLFFALGGSTYFSQGAGTMGIPLPQNIPAPPLGLPMPPSSRPSTASPSPQ